MAEVWPGVIVEENNIQVHLGIAQSAGNGWGPQALLSDCTRAGLSFRGT